MGRFGRVSGARSHPAARRTRWLERRLESRGGCCDCEVFRGGWPLRNDLQVRDEAGDLGWPTERPPCAGVGPRSSQPCASWVPWRRPRW